MNSFPFSHSPLTESLLAQHNNNAITSQFSHSMSSLSNTAAETQTMQDGFYNSRKRTRTCVVHHHDDDAMYNSDNDSSEFYNHNSTDEEEDSYNDKYDGDYQLSPTAHEEEDDDDHLLDEDFLPEVKQEEEEMDEYQVSSPSSPSSSSSSNNRKNTQRQLNNNNNSNQQQQQNQQKRKKKNKKDCVDEHDIDTFQCGQCSRVYQYLSSLKSHCKSVHKSDAGWKGQYSNVISKKFAKNRDFACPLCDSSCASHYGLRRHMTTKHRDAQKKLSLFYLIEDLCLKENMKHKDLVLSNNKEYVLKLKKKHLDELEQDLEICNSPSNEMSDEEEERTEKKPKQKHTRGQGKWTESEKRHFLEGVKIYGKNNLNMIAKFIKTKDMKQVEKFSNKYFSKLREGFQAILGSSYHSAPVPTTTTATAPSEDSNSGSEEERFDSEDEEKVNDSEDREDSDVSPRSKPIAMKRKRKTEEFGRKKIKKEFPSSLSDLLLEGPDLSSTPPVVFTMDNFLGNSAAPATAMNPDETLLQQQVHLRLQALHQQHLMLQKQQEEEEFDIKPDVVELFNNMLFDESVHSHPSYGYQYQAHGCQFMIDTHDHH